MRSMITARFESDAEVQHAVDALIEHHCAAEDIGVLAPGPEGPTPTRVQLLTGLRDGGLIGAGVGAIAGAAATVLVVNGVIDGPGLDAVAAMTPQLAAVEGFVLGGAGGALVGALIGLGRWREEVAPHPTVQGKPTVVGVLAQGQRLAELRHVLEDLGGEDVHVHEPGDAPQMLRAIRMA